MTAATLSRLPLMAGGTLAGSLGRGALWLLARMFDLLVWALGRYMRAPLTISAILAIVGFSVLAASNALYFQTGRHPSPFLFPALRQAATVQPVVPAPRPRLLPVAIDSATTGSVSEAPAVAVINNADVMALQKKLAALKLFGGTADGRFGRRTAAAIKSFEMTIGMKPSGRLTPALLTAVLAAPATAAPQPQPLAAAHSVPATTTVATSAPGAASAPAQPQAIAPKPSAGTNGKPVPLASTRTSAQPTVAAAAQPVNLLPRAETPHSAAAAPVAAPLAGAENLGGDSSIAMNNLPVAAPATPAVVPPATAQALSPAQKLAAQMGTLPPEATAGNALPPATVTEDGDSSGSTDPVLITKIQRGLASLGFLGAKIDGVPGEGTAKAIRNFEVFYDYQVTGLASAQLLSLLIQHGAVI